MAGFAGFIDLPRGNAGQPDPGTFGTPHRAITIPDSHRCAGKGLSRRDSREEKE
jgi:hypothetical protein